MDANLRVIGGPFSEKMIEVPRGKLVIGRAEECDVRPNSEFVSNRHCVLFLDNYTLSIRDLGSKNGTIVNGRRIGKGVTTLLHDDIISIGDMNILVDLSRAKTGTELADSETLPPVSPNALQATGVFEGDTLQAEIPGAIPPPASPSPVSAPLIPIASPPPTAEK